MVANVVGKVNSSESIESTVLSLRFYLLFHSQILHFRLAGSVMPLCFIVSKMLPR